MPMKSSLKSLMLVASLATLGYSSMSFAHPPHGDRHGDKSMRGGPMAKMQRAFARLDLSEEQQAQLKALKADNKDAMLVLKDKDREYRKQMRQLLDTDNIDENAVRSLAVTMAENRSELMIQGARMRNQAVAVLTDEQRAKFNLMKEKMREKRQSKRKAMKELMSE